LIIFDKTTDLPPETEAASRGGQHTATDRSRRAVAFVSPPWMCFARCFVTFPVGWGNNFAWFLFAVWNSGEIGASFLWLAVACEPRKRVNKWSRKLKFYFLQVRTQEKMAFILGFPHSFTLHCLE
jgi:hypothetical protein